MIINTTLMPYDDVYEEVSFTMTEESLPSSTFTYHNPDMQTQEAREAKVKSHCKPCTVDDAGYITHVLSWDDMSKDIDTGESLDLTKFNTFVVYDTAFYKAERVDNGFKYYIRWGKVKPDETWTCICEKNGAVCRKGAGVGVFGATLNSEGQMCSRPVNSPPITNTYTPEGFYNLTRTGRTGTFNLWIQPLLTYVRILHLFMYANRDSQEVSGVGIVGPESGDYKYVNDNWNYMSGWSMYSTSSNVGITVMGIHNLWGNGLELVGECLVDNNAYISFGTDWGKHQSFSNPSIPSSWHGVQAVKAPSSGSLPYTVNMAEDSVCPFFPSNVTDGSNKTYYCDVGSIAQGTSSTGYFIYTFGAHINSTGESKYDCGLFGQFASGNTSVVTPLHTSRLCVLISE